MVITESAHSSFNRRGYSWPTHAGIGASGSHRELPRVKISDLTAQGWLGCVQPPFRRHREAAFLGDRDEIAKMAQLQALSHAYEVCGQAYKVFLRRAMSAHILITRAIESLQGEPRKRGQVMASAAQNAD